MRNSRTLLCATGLFVLGSISQMAQACVATYVDSNVNTAQDEVEAWAWVEDYYDSGSCFQNAYFFWAQYWEHTYEATVYIESPTQNSAYDHDGEADVAYGGGSADAFTSLSFLGDPGVYDIELLISIFCSVGGLFVDEDEDRFVEVPLYASYDEWPTDECNVERDYSPSNPIHLGKDVDATDFGTDVVSMEDGTVIATRDTGTPGGEENFVIVQGSDGMYTIYAHVTPSVEVDDTVSAGDKIGTVDDTGDTTGSHVHLCRSPIQSCSQGVDYELPDCP